MTECQIKKKLNGRTAKGKIPNEVANADWMTEETLMPEILGIFFASHDERYKSL